MFTQLQAVLFTHSTEVQQLMACLLYSRTGLENSPYASLLDPVHWLDICDLFAKDACALLGLSLESPLQVCVTAGCVAQPSLLQLRQVMQQQQVAGVWTSKDELPVSSLSSNFFACEVASSLYFCRFRYFQFACTCNYNCTNSILQTGKKAVF